MIICKFLSAATVAATALSGASDSAALAASTDQRIVFVRHGEKPPGGLDRQPETCPR